MTHTPWHAPGNTGPLMTMARSDVVRHVCDLLLSAILLDRAGMPIAAEIQRTKAAVVRKEWGL